MDRYIGKLLDNRYEILEKIGSGGMADVYKARCHRLNRLVAIKILKEDLSQDAEFRRRFHAESQAVAMLSHPNIVSVYDVSRSDNIDYIVMELIEGITLKQYMEQKGTLNWREALHFSTQICKALEHAHSRGIVHRDIKPHNIMILKDGSVKVADFGIARVSSAQNTLTREALGSVHYISPEQAKGAQVDCRADLYSLGVVMYEMLTGRPPYDGDTPVSVAIQHINGHPTMPRELNPSIPLGLEQITMHAMTAELSHRYPSATRMLHDLEEFRKEPNIVFDFTAEADSIDVQRLLNDPDYMPKTLGRTNAVKGALADAVAKKKQLEQDKKAQQDASRRGSRIAVIAGVVCIALAVIVICYFLYNYFFSGLFGKTEETAVPRLIGLTADQIRAEDYPDFVIQIDGYVESSQYAAGVVVDQSPLPEKQAKVGSTIKLTVSAGVSETKMPPLVNLTRQNAEQQLNALGLNLNIQIEERKDDIYTEGYVIQTDPVSDTPLTSGQTVTLVVSLGPDIELTEVPTLVGEDVDKALQMIADAGLQNGSIRSDDSDLPAGTVTFQSIDGGQMVKKDTVINLRVSKGPEEAATPVVTNLTQDQAVLQDESVTLSISAYASDDGTLRYAWYLSADGGYENAALVSRSREGNTTCAADTSVPGTYYYFCVVENSLGDDTKTTKSNMIEVVVQEKTVEKTIEINLPSKNGLYEITVYVDGVLQYGPASVSITDDRSVIVEVTVRGKGTLPVDVYLDGAIYDSQLILFESAHGRVSHHQSPERLLLCTDGGRRCRVPRQRPLPAAGPVAPRRRFRPYHPAGGQGCSGGASASDKRVYPPGGRQYRPARRAGLLRHPGDGAVSHRPRPRHRPAAKRPGPRRRQQGRSGSGAAPCGDLPQSGRPRARHERGNRRGHRGPARSACRKALLPDRKFRRRQIQPSEPHLPAASAARRRGFGKARPRPPYHAPH